MSSESPIDPTLERRLDAEMRRQMSEAEREAHVLAAKRRTFSEVAREAVDRGDAVTVAAGGVEFAGIGVYARGDLMTVVSPSALVEVHLAAIDWLRIDSRAPAGGQSSPIEAESFAARLGLLEMTGEAVTAVGRRGTPRIAGKVTAVARDHAAILTDDEREWFVPLAEIAFVIRPR